VNNKTYHSPFNIAVLAAGLGFFIDAFDLFLFNVYRIPSLKELGLTGTELTRVGEWLLSVQMLGMMVGGILSGVIADKKGRVTVMFGSILLYSVSNLANGFVNDVNTYAIIRFFAGVGLAGELGAGITLVGESMSIKQRGYGTILVATLGALGAITAGLSGAFLPWREAFIVAGVAGFLLLFVRVKSMESSLFESVKQKSASKGSLFLLLSDKKRMAKYLACIALGVPIWYSVGLLITLSPELAELHNISGLKLSVCFILFQCGIASGDLSSGLISQWLKSRKWVIFGFMMLGVLATIFHFSRIFHGYDLSVTSFLMGLGCGYLSVFVTTTAEHFGTNLRVTVTATVTNFMRGAVTLLIPFHQWIEKQFEWSLSTGLAVTGMLVWTLAIISVVSLPETYGKSMDYLEE
jgi:MFS transporter, putative metabolite:H+ symporter